MYLTIASRWRIERPTGIVSRTFGAASSTVGGSRNDVTAAPASPPPPTVYSVLICPLRAERVYKCRSSIRPGWDGRLDGTVLPTAGWAEGACRPLP